MTAWRTWVRDLPPTRSARPPGRYVLVYDDGCAFCTAAARWVERKARLPLELMALSAVESASGLLGSLTAEQLAASAHFITSAGREYHGGEAITRALRLWRWGWLVRPLDWPGVTVLRALGYQLTARNRGLIGRVLRVPPA